MNFPKSARYSWVMNHVTAFFLQEKVTDFPIDPFTIIKRNKWGLLTYTELAEQHGVSVEDVINAFQSDDGYTTYDGMNYCIAYNDTIRHPGRIRFTLMHEIGHIYLNHLEDFNETILRRSTLTETKYKILEDEANAFSRNTLAPVVVVNHLNITTIKDLVNHFQITPRAALTRFDLLKTDLRNMVRPLVMSQLKNFKKFIYNTLHIKLCLHCKYSFIHETAQFCLVCGHDKLLNKKGVDEMIYSGFELDENGRATICPRCENEQLENGEHCKICGVYLINKCSSVDFYGNLDCDTILDGKSRFCTHCGYPSTFLQNYLLKPWEECKKELEERDNNPFVNATTGRGKLKAVGVARSSDPFDISDE